MANFSTQAPGRGAPVLVTGATGYVGGRLVPRLLGAGYRVRYANWLWGLRGAIDRMLGGIGLRRGRRDAQQLAPGAKRVAS